MKTPASEFVWRIEGDLRSAIALGHASYLILEPVGGLDEQGADALLRVISHLQGHLAAVLDLWDAAIEEERAAQFREELKPAA